MAIAAAIAWVLTGSLGVYMLRTCVARGGLRRQRATGVGVPPAVVFGHASAAFTGLLIWLGFIQTGWDPLAWFGVALIAGTIALGIGTVTLWTPYPVAVPPVSGGRGGLGGKVSPQERGGLGGSSPREDTVTDEMIAGLLADPFPGSHRPRLKLAALIPVTHGFAALTTFMLAVLAAVNARLGRFRSQSLPAHPWTHPRLGNLRSRQAIWNHGRHADDDGRTRTPRRRSVEHGRRAGGLLRPGHPDRGGDVHQRRVRGRARRGQARAERPRRAGGGSAAPGGAARILRDPGRDQP